MQVVHETIYLALYVHGRVELHRELHKALRTGRARRKSHGHAQQPQPQPHYRDPMVMISERPARSKPTPFPGIGKAQRSAIGTLVERTTRYVMLIHLPNNHGAEALRDPLTETSEAAQRRSLTWDQGSELGGHKAFTTTTGVPVYGAGADPGSVGTGCVESYRDSGVMGVFELEGAIVVCILHE